MEYLRRVRRTAGKGPFQSYCALLEPRLRPAAATATSAESASVGAGRVEYLHRVCTSTRKEPFPQHSSHYCRKTWCCFGCGTSSPATYRFGMGYPAVLKHEGRPASSHTESCEMPAPLVGRAGGKFPCSTELMAFRMAHFDLGDAKTTSMFQICFSTRTTSTHLRESGFFQRSCRRIGCGSRSSGLLLFFWCGTSSLAFQGVAWDVRRCLPLKCKGPAGIRSLRGSCEMSTSLVGRTGGEFP